MVVGRSTGCFACTRTARAKGKGKGEGRDRYDACAPRHPTPAGAAVVHPARARLLPSPAGEPLSLSKRRAPLTRDILLPFSYGSPRFSANEGSG